MDKRDIYEHLANIYLDASASKKKKSKKKHKFKKYIVAGSTAVILLGFVSFAVFNKKELSKASEVALVLYPDTAKINFNFDPAKKEIYSIKLNSLSLSRYKTLAFSVRKSNFRDKLSLRVEFTNSFREKSNLYLKDIPHKWKSYRISLSDFKNITYWGNMVSLDFVAEEWNAKDKKDVIYLDNIRVLH